MIFTDFDEFLKASKALNATEQCFFFVKSWPKSVYLAGVTIFTDFDEFLKASKALNATKQCFFFMKSWPKSVYLVKRARHIYLHQVHVILLMLTAETVTLNNWTILQNVFCILFRKYSRHIHLRHVYVVLIMVTPRTTIR